MKELHFRTATIEDLPVLYDFEQGIIQTERPFDETLKSSHINYYDLKAMIESTDSEVIVAVHQKEIIGSSYVSFKQAAPYLKHTYFAYLGFMYVKPECRGKGVSKRITEEIKNLARKKNITELRLDVYHENKTAIRAYVKAGLKRHITTMRIEL